MPPFAPNAPVDLALKERIRHAYYAEERPIVEVEAVAGVARGTLYRWFHLWGWPLRKPMRSRARRQRGPVFAAAGAAVAGRPEAGAGGPEAGATGWRTVPRESLKLRLRRLVEHRIALLEHEAMAGVAVDPDANARAIELNARTLVTIERLGGEPEPCPTCSDGRPTRSLVELRDELFGHLHRIRREERERAGLPPEDHEDNEPDAEAASAGSPALDTEARQDLVPSIQG